MHCSYPAELKEWSQDQIISITWEFVRNANLEALPKPTEWKFLGMGPEIGILTSTAGELMHDKNWPKAHIKNLDS